jgi:CubicO group peptidase (beta-lactamase class C family)
MTLLVGVAIDEGQLGLDQTLNELLPHYRSQMTRQMGSITLRHLLTMTSGIPADSGMPVLSADDTVGQILTYGTVGDPGERFAYSRSAAHDDGQ